jgi:hypothetical protein
MRVTVFGWCALLGVAVAPATAGEPVNLSRYVAAVQIAGDFALDSVVMSGLCRDEDGCEVTLSLTFAPFDIEESQAARTRLFLSTNGNRWFAVDGQKGVDGGDGVESVLHLAAAPPPGEAAICDLGDGPAGGADTVVGFYLSGGQTLGSPAHICRLVVID